MEVLTARAKIPDRQEDTGRFPCAGVCKSARRGLEFHTTCSIKESWSEFKKAIIEAQKELPLVPDKEERDWVT